MKITMDLLAWMGACEEGTLRFVELWGPEGKPELSTVVERLLQTAFDDREGLDHTEDGMYLRWLLLNMAGPFAGEVPQLMEKSIGCNAGKMMERIERAVSVDRGYWLWVAGMDAINAYLCENLCSDTCASVLAKLYRDLAALIEKKGNQA